MPFKSKAQRRKFYADPKLRKYADRFEKETPKGAKLPNHVDVKGLAAKRAKMKHRPKAKGKK
jgi:hypothetical protein